MDLRQTNLSRGLLLLILLVLLVTQFSAVNLRSFWEDESVTGRLATQTFGEIIRSRGENNHPPLYWISAAVWSREAGDSDRALKAYSVLWLIGAFLLAYRFAQKLLSQHSALISAALFSISPIVVTYGHNARYYSMGAAIGLLAALSVYQFMQTGRKWWLMLYILAGISLIYTFYAGGTLLVALNLWWFIRWLQKQRELNSLLSWGASQAIILAAYFPWLGYLSGAVERNFSTAAPDGLLKAVVVRTGYLVYAFEIGEFISPLNPIAWVGIIAVSGAAIFASMKYFRQAWPILLILGVVCVSGIYVNTIAEYPQSAPQNLSNRLFFIYPFFAMLVSLGLAKLGPRVQVLTFGVIFLVYGVGLYNYFNDRQALKPILIVPWREIMADINAAAAPDAVRICGSGDVTCRYYLDVFGFPHTSLGMVQNTRPDLPEEFWFIQTNIGETSVGASKPPVLSAGLQENYRQVDVFLYAPHDPQIDALKARFLNSRPYSHRLEVYRFVLQPPE